MDDRRSRAKGLIERGMVTFTLRPVGIAALWALGLLCLLLGVGVLSLQVDPISTFVGRRVAGLVSSQALSVEVDRVQGSWIRNLTLIGLHASSGPGTGADAGSGWSASIDTVSLHYLLLPLLKKKLTVRSLTAAGADFRLDLGSSGSGVVGKKTPWTVQLDSVQVRRGDVRIRESGGGTSTRPGASQEPSSWRLSNALLQAGRIEIGSGVSAVIDRLEGAFHPAGLEGEWGHIRGAGTLGESWIRVDSLLLESPESHLTAHGTLPLALHGLAPDLLDMQIAAAPLHLKDVGPFLPAALPDSIRVRLQGAFRSENDTLLVKVDAESSVPGRLQVQGAVTGLEEGSGIDGRMEVTGLDLMAWGLSASPRVLDAHGTAQVEGTLQGARGVTELEVTVKGGNDGQRESLSLGAESPTVADPWQGEWSVSFGEVQTRGTGNLTLGDHPQWRLEGQGAYSRASPENRVAGLDLGGFQGRFHVAGSGLTRGSLDGEGEIQIDSGTVGRATVDRLTVTGGLDGGMLNLVVDGAVAGGRVEARARGDLSTGTGRLVEGHLIGVDLSAILGDTLPSQITADLTGQLLSTSPLRVEGELGILQTRYRGVTVDSASARIAVEEGSATLNLSAAVPDSGRIRGSGRYVFGETSPSFRLDSLRFAELNLRRILPSGDTAFTGSPTGTRAVPTTRLNGRVTGEMEEAEQGWTGRLEFELASSLSGVQEIDGGQLNASLSPGSIQVEGALHLPDGGLDIKASLEGSGAGRRLVVSRADLRQLPVGAFLGWEERHPSVLTGTLQADLVGAQVRQMQGQMGLELENSQVYGVHLGNGRLDLQLTDGVLDGSLRAVTGGNTARGTAQVSFTGDQPEYTGDLFLSLSELETLGSSAESKGNFFSKTHLEGRGMDLPSLSARVRMDVDSARWQGVPVEQGVVQVAMEEAKILVDTAFVRSPAGSLAAWGTFPLESGPGEAGEISFHGELDQADLLAGLLKADVLAVGEAGVDGTAVGALDDLTISSRGKVTALLWNNARIQNLEWTERARRRKDEGFIEGDGELSVDQIRLPHTPIRQVRVAVGLKGGRRPPSRPRPSSTTCGKLSFPPGLKKGRRPPPSVWSDSISGWIEISGPWPTRPASTSPTVSKSTRFWWPLPTRKFEQADDWPDGIQWICR